MVANSSQLDLFATEVEVQRDDRRTASVNSHRASVGLLSACPSSSLRCSSAYRGTRASVGNTLTFSPQAMEAIQVLINIITFTGEKPNTS